MEWILNKKLNFGKHKGKKVSDIINSHPSYIKWCLENVKGFTLTKKQKKKLDTNLEEAENYRTSSHGYDELYDYEYGSDFQFMDFHGNF